MKKLIFTISFFALLSVYYSCSDNNSTNSTNSNLPIMPLAVGNYWAFEVSLPDSFHINIPPRYDTIRITSENDYDWRLADNSLIKLKTFFSSKYGAWAYNNDTLYQGGFNKTCAIITCKFHRNNANNVLDITTKAGVFSSCLHYLKFEHSRLEISFKEGVGPVKIIDYSPVSAIDSTGHVIEIPYLNMELLKCHLN